MPVSRAHVATDRPERYARQLAEHLGRRNKPVVTAEGTRLVFAHGTCLLNPATEHLLLTATAADQDALAAVEELVSRHLERIGRRDQLVVAWVRE